MLQLQMKLKNYETKLCKPLAICGNIAPFEGQLASFTAIIGVAFILLHQPVQMNTFLSITSANQSEPSKLCRTDLDLGKYFAPEVNSTVAKVSSELAKLVLKASFQSFCFPKERYWLFPYLSDCSQEKQNRVKILGFAQLLSSKSMKQIVVNCGHAVLYLIGYSLYFIGLTRQRERHVFI